MCYKYAWSFLAAAATAEALRGRWLGPELEPRSPAQPSAAPTPSATITSCPGDVPRQMGLSAAVAAFTRAAAEGLGLATQDPNGPWQILGLPAPSGIGAVPVFAARCSALGTGPRPAADRTLVPLGSCFAGGCFLRCQDAAIPMETSLAVPT